MILVCADAHGDRVMAVDCAPWQPARAAGAAAAGRADEASEANQDLGVLVSVSYDRTCKFWDLRSGAEVASLLAEHSGEVCSPM
jgi:hypothetical protein